MRIHQTLSVPYEYDVVFTRGVFDPDNEALAEVLPRVSGGARAAVFVDEGVSRRWPDLPKRIKAWCAAHPDCLRLAAPPLRIPGGEAVKNDLTFVQRMTHQFQRFQLCRHSYVVAVGGGAVLDAVGLAAAVFHRGLRLIRVPTTVLAQADSGVGVKNAINLDGVKNLIGAFAPPAAVLNDALFLTTLEARDWTSGLAEAFKVAFIKDAAFLEELETLAPALRARDLDAMERVIVRCAQLHLEHLRTSGDPFEFGSARPLDFGHWAAHKLESLSRHELRHGEAVALGMAIDLFCAERLMSITCAERDRACDALVSVGLRLWDPLLTQRNSVRGELALWGGLEEFRQHLGGELTLTFPQGLGRQCEVRALLPAAWVEEAVAWLAARAGVRTKTTGTTDKGG